MYKCLFIFKTLSSARNFEWLLVAAHTNPDKFECGGSTPIRWARTQNIYDAKGVPSARAPFNYLGENNFGRSIVRLISLNITNLLGDRIASHNKFHLVERMGSAYARSRMPGVFIGNDKDRIYRHGKSLKGFHSLASSCHQCD